MKWHVKEGDKIQEVLNYLFFSLILLQMYQQIKCLLKFLVILQELYINFIIKNKINVK